MRFPLLRKSLLDGAWMLVAGSATLLIFAWIRMAIVGSMELYQFQRIARNLPDLVKSLLPVPIDQFISYPGLVSFTFEEPLAYLIMAWWAIARGSDSVSGELGRGTLEMLLAQPVSRLRYLLAHSAVTLAGIAVLAMAPYIGSWLGLHTVHMEVRPPRPAWTFPFIQPPTDPAKMAAAPLATQPLSDFVKPRLLRPAVINFACLGVMLAGIATAASAADRYRSRTIGLMVGFYVVQSVLELIGMAMPNCRWMLKLTLFSAYEPVAFVTAASRRPEVIWEVWSSESKGVLPDLGPLGCDLVLLGVGMLGLLIGLVIFCRRDLPAPL
jgi:ABC-2 type transport system permease protein